MAALYSWTSRGAEGASESRPDMVLRDDHVDKLEPEHFSVAPSSLNGPAYNFEFWDPGRLV